MKKYWLGGTCLFFFFLFFSARHVPADLYYCTDRSFFVLDKDAGRWIPLVYVGIEFRTLLQPLVTTDFFFWGGVEAAT